MVDYPQDIVKKTQHSDIIFVMNNITETKISDEATAIEVFRIFQRGINKIDTYPLSKKNLVIQQDAYKRLINFMGDDVDSSVDYEPFAELENSRKSTDNDMRFLFQFTPFEIHIAIEGAQSITLPYTWFKSSKTAAEHVLELAIVLSNGQMALLASYNPKWCFTEILFFDQQSQVPRAQMYDSRIGVGRWGSDNIERFTADILRNKYDIGRIKLSATHLLGLRTPDGVVHGFDYKRTDFEPMTRSRYEAISEEISKKTIIVKENETFMGSIAFSWEFWLITILLFGGTVALLLLLNVPEKVWYLLPFAVFITSVIGLGVASLLHIVKANLRAVNSESKYIRIDNFFTSKINRFIYADATSKAEKTAKLKRRSEKIRKLIPYVSIASALAMVYVSVQFKASFPEGAAGGSYWIIPAVTAFVSVLVGMLGYFRVLSTTKFDYLASITISFAAIIAFNTFETFMPGAVSIWIVYVATLYFWASYIDYYSVVDGELEELLASNGDQTLSQFLSAQNNK